MRYAFLIIFVLFIPVVAQAQPISVDSGFIKEAAKPLHPLCELEPGCWAALGTNTLNDVRYVPEPAGKPIQSIMLCWSGAAYNTDEDQLWVHGGGHSGGADNCVYAFDVETLTWIRLFDPSTVVEGHTDRYYLDGKPAAVHTYDYIEYLPCLGRMVVAGAAGPYPGTAKYVTVDAVDSSGDWQHLADLPYTGWYGSHPMAAVHPETGILWHHGGESCGFLSSYDALNDTWIEYGDTQTDLVPGCWRTAAIDPKNRKFVIIQTGYYSDQSVWMWDISVQFPGVEIKGEKLDMTGDTEILLTSGPPGLEWHARKEKLYAWHGGIDVYEIDVIREKIIKVPVDPANTVIPDNGTPNGVYGRWRYVAKYNVLMGVNSVFEPVYFFRLP